MKIIEISFVTKGQTKVETRGFTGGECRVASRFIEQALGQGTDEKLTTKSSWRCISPRSRRSESWLPER